MVEGSFLTATREAYDAIAADYPVFIRAELDGKPVDRALLSVFAEWVAANGNGLVADIGCGPGRVTVVLRNMGLNAFGIDLSPEMIALARRTYPDLRFEVGSMLALDLPDASLGGVLAHYSIIHVPWEYRPQVFAEFYRVLAPGGQLMLSFQVGDDCVHFDRLGDHPVSLDQYRQRPDEVADLLARAGFTVQLTAVWQKDGSPAETTPQGYLLAHKPAT